MTNVFVAAFIAAFVPSVWAADAPVPTLTRRVTDLTQTLSAAETGKLEGFLSDLEKRTSNQIVVLVIPSLEGREIREYGVEVAQKNRLGQKGKDNGALLLIAKADRKVTIEVGYGLEGTLPDAVCSQIIRREITPRFRSGDYFGGIASGVSGMAAAIGGEYRAEKSRRSSGDPIWSIVTLAFMFGVFLISGLFSSRTHRVSGGGYRRSGWIGGMGAFLGSGGFGGFGGGGGGFSGGGGGFGGGGASGGW